MSNLYFVGCVYSRGIDENWRQCTAGPGPRWGYTFLLAQLPLLVRLVQSVKRYADSGLVTHLINVCPFDAALQPTIEANHGSQGGKYGSGIVSYLFYYLWRAQGKLASLALLRWSH